MKQITFVLFVISLSLGSLTACTKQQLGTAGGAALGAGLGSSVGGEWGAAAGAAGGAFLGNHTFKDKH